MRGLRNRTSRPSTVRLASRGGTWHWPVMAASPNPAAGGAFIALGALGGAAIGVATGQTSAGLVVGLGLGVVLAIVIWLRTRG